MTTTTTSKKVRGGSRSASKEPPPSRPSKDQEVLRKWFPKEDDLESFVDGILDQAEELKNADKSENEGMPAKGLFDGLDCVSIQVETPNSRASTSLDLRDIVSEAFLSMFKGRPEDHVIIDPQANTEFICRCHTLGAELPEFILNKMLLNLRKSGRHTGLDRGSGQRLDREELDSMGFAAEISAKLLQLEAAKNGWDVPSIDRILCDPQLRNRFDTSCRTLSPGFSLYQYRLAVLSYRKSGRESSHRLASVDTPDWDKNAPLKGLNPDDAPCGVGVYTICAGRTTVFTGATLSLQNRLLTHLRVDDGSRFVPPSLYDRSWRNLIVRWFAAPLDWRPRKADAVALKITRESNSLFNLYSNAI